MSIAPILSRLACRRGQGAEPVRLVQGPRAIGRVRRLPAGVIATNPEKADQLINRCAAAAGDQWVGPCAPSPIRDIRTGATCCAASPPSCRARQVMIDQYLTGQLPRLYQYEKEPSISTWDSVKSKVTGKELPKAHVLEPSPELLDTYWGYYFATGHARPISAHRDAALVAGGGTAVDKLTLGSMAKYTLASNASRGSGAAGRAQRGARAHPERYREGLTR